MQGDRNNTVELCVWVKFFLVPYGGLNIYFSGNIKLTGKLKSIVKWIMLILTVLIIAGIKMEIKMEKGDLWSCN